MKRAGRGLLVACLSLAWAGGVLAQPAPQEHKDTASAKKENLKNHVFPKRGTYTLHDVRVLADDGNETIVVQAGNCTDPDNRDYTLSHPLEISRKAGDPPFRVYRVTDPSTDVGSFRALKSAIEDSKVSARLKGDSLKGYVFWNMNLQCSAPSPTGSGFVFESMNVGLPQFKVPSAYASASSHEDLKDRDPDDSGLLAPDRTYALLDAKVIKATKDHLTLAPASVTYTAEKDPKTTVKTDIKTVILPLATKLDKNAFVSLLPKTSEFLASYGNLLPGLKEEADWTRDGLEGFTFPRVEFSTTLTSKKELVAFMQVFTPAENMKGVDPALVKGRTYILRNAKVVKHSKHALVLAPASVTYTGGGADQPTDAGLKTVMLMAKNGRGGDTSTSLVLAPWDQGGTKVKDFKGLLTAMKDKNVKLPNDSLAGFVFAEVKIKTSMTTLGGVVNIMDQTLTVFEKEHKDR